jgi:hypothetical protein
MAQEKTYFWGSKISPKMEFGAQKSKINFSAKKIKTSRHFKKCMLKKLLSDSKEKNVLRIHKKTFYS